MVNQNKIQTQRTMHNRNKFIRSAVFTQMPPRFKTMRKKNNRISSRRLVDRDSAAPDSRLRIAGTQKINETIKQLMICLGWLRLIQKIYAPVHNPLSRNRNTSAY